MRSEKPTLVATLSAGAPLKTYQMIGYDCIPVAADDARVAAIVLQPANLGHDFPAMVEGMLEMPVSGAVQPGDRVIAAADGRSVKKAPVEAVNVCGVALRADQNGFALVRLTLS